MSHSSGIMIEWAVVAGRIAHISEFVGRRHGDRPYAQCEVCRCRLVMRLGRRRAHHFAHYPGAGCPLTAPESALHYNSVRALANALRQSRSLTIRANCRERDDRQCTGTVVAKPADNWDAVHVEVGLATTRPDITLIRGGVPILAIEVRQSNPVNQKKAVALAEVPLPWIEVLAGPDCTKWSEALPLPVADHGGVIDDCRCAVHASRVRLVRAAQATVRRTASSGSVHTQKAWRFRIVDWYPSDGSRLRRLYWMYWRGRPKGLCELLIIEHGTERAIVRAARTGSIAAAFGEASRGFDMYLRRSGILYDSPMEWHDAASLLRATAMYDKTRFPPRYLRDDVCSEWRTIAGYERVRW